MTDFKFGVQDYSRTYANHSARLAKYQEACEADDKLRFTWKDDPCYDAEVIIQNSNFTPLTTKKRIKTNVNYHFIGEIQHYLNCTDQNKYWFTAVYLDCYAELNKYMNEVANTIANVTM